MADICLCVAEASVEKMLKLIKAERLNYTMVEIRVDALISPSEEELFELCQKLVEDGIPFVWTVRWKNEKGLFEGTEEERLHLIKFGDQNGATFVDVEAFSSIAASFRPIKAKLIISHHNFEELPSHREELLDSMKELKPDIYKIAFACHCTKDLRKVYELYEKDLDAPLIAIAMGEWGESSRVLAVKLGMPWSYASAGIDVSTAPGQLTARDLKHLYRLDQVDDNTELLVVIGDPVSHSLSPQLHNKLYDELGINALYSKIHVDDTDEFYRIADILKLKGASVTVPHKESLMRWVSEDDSLYKISAANTLIRDGESWRVINSDISGAMEAIKCYLGDISSPKVLMLGAGGAAKGLSYGMSEAGWQMTIANRSQAKAEALAEEVKGEWLHWDDRNPHGFDVVINSTSIGMSPNEDQTPMELEGSLTGLIVFDAVYTPEMTVFLTDAKRAGALIITGREMFYRQAALQHQVWFGGTAPFEEMEKILAEIS